MNPLGLYEPGSSALHRLGAGWKFAGLLVFAVLAFVFLALKFSAFGIAWQESEAVYLIYGFCSFLLLAVFTANQRICSLLSNRTLAYLGKSSMGIYLLHPVVYEIIGSAFSLTESSPILVFILAFFASVCATVALAILAVRLIHACTGGLYQVFLKIRARFIPMDLSA